jgi:hypothetical protein
MLWICPIVGGAAMPSWHVLLHLGLAGAVVIGGAVFLALAVVAYRRPVPRPGAGPTPRTQTGSSRAMRIRLLMRPFDS